MRSLLRRIPLHDDELCRRIQRDVSWGNKTEQVRVTSGRKADSNKASQAALIPRTGHRSGCALA
jgi:hypothetical protein